MNKMTIVFISAIIILAGLVYFLTLAPTVTLIDSGELATVSKTLGIAHPTGYPLYTLLARVATMAGFEPVVLNTNLLSTLFSLASVVALFLIINLILGTVSPQRKLENHLVSFFGAMLFAFSRTLWSVTVVTEVYSLTTFISVLLCLVLCYWKNSGNTRILVLFCFLLGLGFGNHLSLILFIPAFIYFILVSDPTIFRKPAFVGILLVFLLLGVTVYLYLPLRAKLSPLMNWGNPTNFERFYRHVSGWQYRVWMFSKTTKDLAGNVKDYGLLLKNQFTPYLLIFIPFGLVYLFKKSKFFLIFMFIVFFSNILYALNYDIPDIDPYFLPSFFVAVIFICSGIKFIIPLVNFKYLAFILPLLLVLPLSANFKYNDLSHRLYEELANNLLKFPAKNSLIIMDNWDYYSPTIYLQNVEGIRPDLTLVDFELLRRSWYIEGLLSNHPEVFKPAKGEMTAFLEVLKPFEKQKDYNPYILQQYFASMIEKFVTENMKEREVFTTFEDKENIFKQFANVPVGLYFQLLPKEGLSGYEYPPVDPGKFETKYLFNKSIYWDNRTRSVMSIYTRMWGKRSNYSYKLKRYHEVKSYLELACQMDPHNLVYWQNLGVITVEMGKYEEAYGIFEKMSELFPEKKNDIKLVLDDLKRKMYEKETINPNREE